MRSVGIPANAFGLALISDKKGSFFPLHIARNIQGIHLAGVSRTDASACNKRCRVIGVWRQLIITSWHPIDRLLP